MAGSVKVTRTDTDVLIAGAGPAGLTLGLALARRGVRCRVIDKLGGPSDASRALGVQPRTLELLDSTGVSAEIERLGNRGTGMQMSSGRRLLVRVPWTQQYSYGSVWLAQPEVERLLREALARAGVAVEWDTELTGFAQAANGVAAATTTGSISAAWLVGADGAHSSVRHILGIGFEGAALPETYLMADVEADWDLVGYDQRIWFHPDGVLVLVHYRDRSWRILASVRDGRAPTDEFFADALNRRAGLKPRAMTVRWRSAFNLHSRLTSTYRVGRAFLAGDAAHVHSPIGGQGMNNGIQDAINLAWKLERVIRGGSEHLLDTYEIERRPVARKVIRTTEPATRIGVVKSPLARFTRDLLLPLVLGLPPVQRSIGSQASGIALSYSGSPLSASGGGARAPFKRGYYTGSWEMFRDRTGAGVLVRPDAYVGARFSRPDAGSARQYLADRVGSVDFVDEGRQLPEDEPPGLARVSALEQV